MDLISIKTPCLVLDIGRVKANAERMLRKALDNNVSLRPHVKTHKCVEVARIAREGQNEAITVSTLAEAWAFAKHGFADILYAVPIEPGKFADMIGLMRRGVDLSVVTDSAAMVPLLNDIAKVAGEKIAVSVKIDCGYHRCGVEADSEEALLIPRLISDSPNLHLAGILTHAGHSYHARSKDELLNIARHERDSMVELASRLTDEGIEVPTISIGSTPTMTAIDHFNGIDEIRPGNYIFFDAFQATLGSCTFADCSLTVLAAVVHRDPIRRKVIIDAGAIALSKDRGPVEFDEGCGYGRVLDINGNDLGAVVTSLSQEHGVIENLDETLLDKLNVGTRVRVLANHSCLAAAQHSQYHVLTNGEIVDKWEIHGGW
jgi:D-serine deaminase-like pyridoxal phosphate-dependent protein